MVRNRWFYEQLLREAEVQEAQNKELDNVHARLPLRADGMARPSLRTEWHFRGTRGLLTKAVKALGQTDRKLLETERELFETERELSGVKRSVEIARNLIKILKGDLGNNPAYLTLVAQLGSEQEQRIVEESQKDKALEDANKLRVENKALRKRVQVLEALSTGSDAGKRPGKEGWAAGVGRSASADRSQFRKAAEGAVTAAVMSSRGGQNIR